MNSPEVEVVLAWHAALNAGDVERVMSLSTANVEVGGPRGAGRGNDLLRDWLARAGTRLEPLQWQSRGHTVVVTEHARWPGADGTPGEPQEVASVFRVEDGRVDSVIRYAGLSEALAAAGLEGQV